MSEEVEVKVDIATLKEKVDKLEEFVSDIKNNHFPHIEKRFDTIETHLAYYVGGGTVVLILSQIFIRLIFR